MGLVTDTVGDALIRIKNGLNAGKPYVLVKKSKFLARILDVIKDNGYIEDYYDDPEVKYHYRVVLKYHNGKPVIKEVNLISKTSRRIYTGYRYIKPFKNNTGIVIISTSKGVMTTKEAKKLKVGGQLICSIW